MALFGCDCFVVGSSLHNIMNMVKISIFHFCLYFHTKVHKLMTVLNNKHSIIRKILKIITCSYSGISECK